MALTEEHGMEKYFQNVDDELRIGTHPNEKCMTALTELKLQNSVTFVQFMPIIQKFHVLRQGNKPWKETHRKRRVSRQLKRQTCLVTTQRTWTRIYNVSHYV